MFSDETLTADYSIELSDDELPFLDLTELLTSKQKDTGVIEFILTTDFRELSNNYLGRINILQNVISPRVNFVFTEKQLSEKR